VFAHLISFRELIFYFSNTQNLVCLSVQAIVSIKKGAYLLKCGRRGKPKLCPFRLSQVSYNEMTNHFGRLILPLL